LHDRVQRAHRLSYERLCSFEICGAASARQHPQQRQLMTSFSEDASLQEGEHEHEFQQQQLHQQQQLQRQQQQQEKWHQEQKPGQQDRVKPSARTMALMF